MNTKVNRKDYENGIALPESYKEDAKLFISPSASNRLNVLQLLFDPRAAQFRILFCHVAASILLGFQRKRSVSWNQSLWVLVAFRGSPFHSNFSTCNWTKTHLILRHKLNYPSLILPTEKWDTAPILCSSVKACSKEKIMNVEALRYKPEGSGFDSRWGHWEEFHCLKLSCHTIALVSTQPPT